MFDNIIVFHKNCADGFAAAFTCFKFLKGQNNHFMPMDYNESVNPVMEVLSKGQSANLWIVDFSFSKEEMELIMEVCTGTFNWYDHHIGAIQKVFPDANPEAMIEKREGNITIVLDPSRCGARITFDELNPGEPVPLMIRLIDDYDRWKFDLTGTKEFNKALWAHAPWSFAQWEILEHMSKDMIKMGGLLLKDHNSKVAAVIAESKMPCAIPVSKDGTAISGFAVNCSPFLSSDVGHALANESGTFGLTWHMLSTGKIKVSLRSNGSFDVNEIAKLYGGGGHKNAAGFHCVPMTMANFLAKGKNDQST